MTAANYAFFSEILYVLLKMLRFIECKEKRRTFSAKVNENTDLKPVVFKLVETRSVERSFLRGLRYANVSLTHPGVDTVRK